MFCWPSLALLLLTLMESSWHFVSWATERPNGNDWGWLPATNHRLKFSDQWPTRNQFLVTTLWLSLDVNSPSAEPRDDYQFSSVTQSCLTLCNPMNGSKPGLPVHYQLLEFTPGIRSCPLSQWCHPAISSSVVPFSSCPQALPASGSFLMSQFFTDPDLL